jgi:hypothetical protein
MNELRDALSKLSVEEATYKKSKALFESAAAHEQHEKAKLSRKEGEIMLQRARNANRPSILLGAEVEETDMGWIARARGASAEGDSPEQAFLAFDETWMGRDR